MGPVYSDVIYLRALHMQCMDVHGIPKPTIELLRGALKGGASKRNANAFLQEITATLLGLHSHA